MFGKAQFPNPTDVYLFLFEQLVQLMELLTFLKLFYLLLGQIVAHEGLRANRLLHAHLSLEDIERRESLVR